MTLEEAIEAQIQSTLIMSALGDAKEVVEVGPIKVVRDAPGRKRPARLEHMIAVGVDPEEVVKAVKAYKPGRWALSAVYPANADQDAIKEAHKALGFRLNIRFPLFVRSLSNPIDVPARHAVQRLTDPKLVAAVWKAKGRRPPAAPLEEGNAKARMYVALVGGEPVGWVRSVRATRIANWVEDLYVLEQHRNKRIGEQLLRQMLEEDKVYGVKNSALLSSSDGKNLYPRLGYEQIGLMQVFNPLRVDLNRAY